MIIHPTATRNRWWVQLRCNESTVALLKALFAHSEILIIKLEGEDGEFFSTPEFSDRSTKLFDPILLRTVRCINGILQLYRDNAVSISTGLQYWIDCDGKPTYGVLLDTVQFHASVSENSLVKVRTWLRGLEDQNTQFVFEVFSDPCPSFRKLFFALEAMENGLRMGDKEFRSYCEGRGWASRKEISDFRAMTNDPDKMRTEARHPRPNSSNDATMDYFHARKLVMKIAIGWLSEKYA